MVNDTVSVSHKVGRRRRGEGRRGQGWWGGGTDLSYEAERARLPSEEPRTRETEPVWPSRSMHLPYEATAPVVI